MTTTIQFNQTPLELFADVTASGRLDYGLWYVLNKMAQAVPENAPYVRNIDYGTATVVSIEYSRWIGNKDADFILSRINFCKNVNGITEHGIWFYDREQEIYELHHIMPDGTSLYVAINRPGRNRNRQICIRKFDKEISHLVVRY